MNGINNGPADGRKRDEVRASLTERCVFALAWIQSLSDQAMNLGRQIEEEQDLLFPIADHIDPSAAAEDAKAAGVANVMTLTLAKLATDIDEIVRQATAQ